MTELSQLERYADLIEYRAGTQGDKPYILHEEQTISFAEFNHHTCRVVNGLRDRGAEPGDGLAILMGNCPEYYYLFNGMPRGGLYTVPINTALKGEGLKYILVHSDVKYLVVDEDLYPKIKELGPEIGKIEKIFVRRTSDTALPENAVDFAELLQAAPDEPNYQTDPNVITHLMYTSGTTGFPKGVVNRAKTDRVQGMVNMAGMLGKPDDVFYPALPLFHANALVITASLAMAGGVPFGLDKKFSASRFWENTRRYGATQFNGIGAMIPILMKQPERPDDRDNSVRAVISAACPINLWEAFEKRFGLQIWEIYGAVDGGGVMTLNMGNAPAGSIGKPLRGEWKLVDENDEEVPAGEIGEMINKVDEGSIRTAEYYKNDEASAKKSQGGWIRSGDLFYADKDKNLYFVDRASDSMRRRGENISSFEVESIVEKYPDVMTCAAFGVPSELGEDEVMLWVKPVAGKTLDLKELIRHCVDNMAFFMIPRYIDMVEDIPRTGTLRSQKAGMKKQGVTDRTWDREKEMPDLKKR